MGAERGKRLGTEERDVLKQCCLYVSCVAVCCDTHCTGLAVRQCLLQTTPTK